MAKKAVPRFEEFVPFGWQIQLLKDMENPDVFDWSKGTHTILLSGAVGSAKSALCGHLMWKHIIKYKNYGAYTVIARQDWRRLQETAIDTFTKSRPKNPLFEKLYSYNKSNLKSYLAGQELMLGMYYSDGDFERFKGLQISAAWLEEGSENVTPEVYEFLYQRTRLPVPEKFIVIATNPDEPDHWINTKLITNAGFINGVKQAERAGIDYTIHVYYSSGADNPYIDKNYYNGLRKTYSAKKAERFLDGKWISLYGQNIYYAYGEHNHKREHYRIKTAYPIRISFDFNTALGKPMSCVFAQYIEGKIHFFDQIALQGNTSQLMEEVLNKTGPDGKKYVDYNCEFIIHGDAAGWAKHSSSNNWNDYEIIKKYLGEYKGSPHGPLRYKTRVDLSNPQVKQRHECVNAHFKSADNSVKIFLWENCFTGEVNLDQAFRLTKLKDGAKYVEDDGVNCPYQHMGTAAGYLVYEVTKKQGGISVINK